jgi:hypothetical protein
MLYWIKLRRDKVLRPQRDQDGAERQPETGFGMPSDASTKNRHASMTRPSEISCQTKNRCGVMYRDAVLGICQNKNRLDRRIRELTGTERICVDHCARA